METKKLAKAARKPADNSTCLHSDSFEINIGKSQGNKSVLVPNSRKNLFLQSPTKNMLNIYQKKLS